jgi:hypothetical protein
MMEITKLNSILLEAEAFNQIGGWVVDQQFMDVMGSPYLLAHGLGQPVEDAKTVFEVHQPGIFRVWVRTRDWTGPWKKPETPHSQRAQGSPGIFQVIINDCTLPVVFGDSGADWHWQDGGLISIVDKVNKIRLHDLTGFEGRCDAILITSEVNSIPPDDGETLRQLRRELMNFPDPPPLTRPFDFIVVGGGIAGICAALAASRCNLRVALIHDRPVLGGNNSSEVRVWLGGKTNFPPYPHLGNLVRQLEPAQARHYGPENTAEIYEDERRIALVKAEKTLKLYLGWRVVAAKVHNATIKEITAVEITSGRALRFTAPHYADCTGDADLGFLAGADFDMTLSGHMGPSNLWNIHDTGQPTNFPRCLWALDLSESPFPGRSTVQNHASEQASKSLGVWFWESGFNSHPIKDLETVRDFNFRAMYGAWDALKNIDKAFATHKLNWSAYITGARESRRLLGDYILRKEDIINNTKFPDGCIPCTWTIDLHVPNSDFSEGFEGTEFISTALHEKVPQPYWAPFRMLYSRNIHNLFMAGRNVSVTHEALGTARVMRTTGMMGEVVGLAAKICIEKNIKPSDIYQAHLEELMTAIKNGVPKTPINSSGPLTNLGG